MQESAEELEEAHADDDDVPAPADDDEEDDEEADRVLLDPKVQVAGVAVAVTGSAAEVEDDQEPLDPASHIVAGYNAGKAAKEAKAATNQMKKNPVKAIIPK